MDMSLQISLWFWGLGLIQINGYPLFSGGSLRPCRLNMIFHEELTSSHFSNNSFIIEYELFFDFEKQIGPYTSFREFDFKFSHFYTLCCPFREGFIYFPLFWLLCVYKWASMHRSLNFDMYVLALPKFLVFQFLKNRLNEAIVYKTKESTHQSKK